VARIAAASVSLTTNMRMTMAPHGLPSKRLMPLFCSSQSHRSGAKGTR
jgi:hypothetical protein